MADSAGRLLLELNKDNLTTTAIILDRDIVRKFKSFDQLQTQGYLFINNTFKPFVNIGMEYSFTEPNSPVDYGQQIQFNIEQYGDFFSDTFLQVTIGETRAIGDIVGVTICDYPMMRLLERAEFRIGNVKIDEYSQDDILFYYLNELPNSKRDSWDRFVGQDTPDVVNYNTADIQIMGQEKFLIQSKQKLQRIIPEFTMGIPLLFWFSTTRSKPFPSRYIPYNNGRFMTFDFAQKNQIFIIDPEDPTLSNIIGGDIKRCVLVSNNIFVNEEVWQLYAKSLSKQLIRVHSFQKTKYQFGDVGSTVRIKLNDLKFPTETIYWGSRTDSGLTGQFLARSWYKFGVIEPFGIRIPIAFTNPVFPFDTIIDSTTAIALKPLQCINRNSLVYKNNIIFPRLDPLINRDYFALVYGDTSVKTGGPDMGTYNFGIASFEDYSRSTSEQQPSGVLNISTLRENLFIELEPTLAGLNTTGELSISTLGWNFIQYSNGLAGVLFSI